MFTQADLDSIGWTADRFPGLSRWELANTVCENLPWKAPNGQLRVHECLPLLEQLGAAGMITPLGKRARAAPARLQAPPVRVTEIVASLAAVRPVTVEPVPAEEQAIWDATLNARTRILSFLIDLLTVPNPGIGLPHVIATWRAG